ncbi:hypothetical protein GCK72_002885 [Caenorhabditis remanei]|uniref:SPK domain-containing protein n=1 Tax=Caenorhabditis remanei TaxID=31234 RepID=A0A6A5HS94_CAERE|nr:hypothetical protein GCK72_002885 [Caenorhabditis remanei]KAF1771060.1 hypothetical protein GCK72_002885 [Caenorhabditis remanei]
MEDYDENHLGINWKEYLKIVPTEHRNQKIGRSMQIQMLQRLLDEGLQNREPIVMDHFWRKIVDEEQWEGGFKPYNDHYSHVLAKKVEKLIFLPIEYRALILFITSRVVTPDFRNQLEEAECKCEYDNRRRIVKLEVKFKSSQVDSVKNDKEEPQDVPKNLPIEAQGLTNIEKKSRQIHQKMEDYDENHLGINWKEYLKIVPTEHRNQKIGRSMQIQMLQRLLDEGLQNREPIVMDHFWRKIVDEEQWEGGFKPYNDHYSHVLAKKVEKLIFLPIEYRALILFITSRVVTPDFRNQLEEAECKCEYDNRRRIVKLEVKFKSSQVDSVKNDKEEPQDVPKNLPIEAQGLTKEKAPKTRQISGMYAIRAGRERVTNEDFMNAVREVGDALRLETKLDKKPV